MKGIPLINGHEYGWGDIICLIAGNPIIGSQALKYDDKQTIENHYGAGRYPVSRGKGRIESSAKIKSSMPELLAIQAKSVTGRIQDLAPFNIQVSYLPSDGKIVHDVIRYCQFLANNRKWTEADTAQWVELELIVSTIDGGRTL